MKLMKNSNWASTILTSQDIARTIIEVKFNRIYADQENGIQFARTWANNAAEGSVINTEGLSTYYQHFTDAGKIETTLCYGAIDGNKSWVYYANRKREKYIDFSVISSSWDAISKLHEQLTSQLIPIAKDTDKTYIGLWRQTARGEAIRERRSIDIRKWDNLSTNYTPHVQKVLGELSSLKPADIDGRILLMWGPAGTGKTTFLRAISHEWRDWASLEYVIDPDRFLNDGDYMTQVLIDNDYEYDHDTDKTLTDNRWRLLVLEDAGELIKADAKRTAGQSLSRLLNMTDGILGEGRNLILAITTNDDISSLHPAVIRPGRCLAQAEIPAFTREEAENWLGHAHSSKFHEIGDKATLAELFHIAKGSGKTVTSTVAATGVATGQYL